MSSTTILIIVVAAIIAALVLLYGIGFTGIGTDEIGIVEKWWSPKGSVSAEGLIALKGEAGFQPEVLRTGVHVKTPFKYKVRKVKLVTIPQGQIAYVFARSGEPLKNGQTLGKEVPECKAFQDVRAFLQNGGQKGPQRQILREGTYAFNLAQFMIITSDKVYSLASSKDEAAAVDKMRNDLLRVDGFRPVLVGSQRKYRSNQVTDQGPANGPGAVVTGYSQSNYEIDSQDTIGIVTINEGPTPDGGAIIAPIVGEGTDNENYHNNFQEPEKFLLAGGRKGKQMQVLTDGVYFINRLFANVDIVPKSIISIGNVGVVISYFGDKGKDVSGETYSHGELVEQGKKGIWKEPMMPGKYAFNTYAGKIVIVPTTNVILKWISGQVGSHKLDDNLKEINLITKDAFEPNLPLTVVFNIDYRKASSVIQRFGDIKLLIEQSLDPMVAGYFKNIGQTKTLIELVQDRSQIQEQAAQEMKEKFKGYDLELQEVLIGTPTASQSDTRIEKILAQLRDRQVATEEIKTNEAKQAAAQKQRELNEAQARAEAQGDLTRSAIAIEVADNKGKSELKLAEQEALKIVKLAEANRASAEQVANANKYTKVAMAEATAKETELIAQANANQIKINAEASAKQVEMQADAEAHRLKATGEAESLKIKAIADATAEQEQKVGEAKGKAASAIVEAYGGAQMQILQSALSSFADALKETKAQLVPNTVMMGKEGEVPNALEGILNLLFKQFAANGDLGLLISAKEVGATTNTDNSADGNNTNKGSNN